MKPIARSRVQSSPIRRILLRDLALGALLFLLLFGLRAGLRAEDVLHKADGSTLTGEITQFQNGTILLKLSAGSVGVPIADVTKVEMAAPAALAETEKAAPDAVLAALQPLVDQFKGLPVPWVPTAMARLAEAARTKGDSAKASAIYADLASLYGGPDAPVSAKIALARHALIQKHIDEALALLQPIIAEVRKAPGAASVADSLGALFLLHGEVLEAKGDSSAAFESYLTTVTLFNHNAGNVAAAKERIAVLTQASPNLQVP